MTTAMTAVGLFAGIGGVEEGLRRAGTAEAELLVDNWSPAQEVLRARFPDAKLEGDVADLGSIPRVDLLTAGFPCTDLSQAGRTAGITGRASGLVSHVFRLLPHADPTWLVFENVRNLLVLDDGRAMRYLVDELEDRGYQWAYRLVDSRAFGVPQRRQRVLLVASRTEDPRPVLLGDDAGERPDGDYRDDTYGFYWTEGLRGLGWAKDAVPTLKGGSTIGIPSPPAIWAPDAPLGQRIVTPGIEDAEALQGFDRGWTDPAATGRSNGPRWRLVGNAVTVGLSEWLGRRLLVPADQVADCTPIATLKKWPLAAYGSRGHMHAAKVSLWPVLAPYSPLRTVVNVGAARPLSHRGAAGFCSRMRRSTLRFDARFAADVADHVDATR